MQIEGEAIMSESTIKFCDELELKEKMREAIEAIEKLYNSKSYVLGIKSSKKISFTDSINMFLENEIALEELTYRERVLYAIATIAAILVRS